VPSGTSAIMTTHTDQRNIHMMAFFHRALYSLFLVCILSSFASAEVSLYEGSLQVKKRRARHATFQSCATPEIYSLP